MSDEFNNRGLSNEEIVNIAYRALLNREADAGGLANWVAHLNSGMSVADLVKGFCGSSGFKSLCDTYGLVSGM